MTAVDDKASFTQSVEASPTYSWEMGGLRYTPVAQPPAHLRPVPAGHKMLGPTASGFMWGRWAERAARALLLARAGAQQCPPAVRGRAQTSRPRSNWLTAGWCCTCRYELLEKMEPLMVGGSTTGEIHFGRHSDAKPPLR